MNRHIHTFTLFLLLLLNNVGSANAGIVCKPGESPTLSGKITPGDFSALVKCLDAYTSQSLESVRSGETKDGYRLSHVGWVYLDSPGGDVNEAIKIGRFFRESLAEVVVSNECLSSCFLAAIGSVKLLAGQPFGKLGIHRVFYGADALRESNPTQYESLYNDIKRGMRAYLHDMDVPSRLTDLMFTTSSEEIYTLSVAEVASLNSHPAFDEWIAAKCPVKLSQRERSDWRAYVSAGFRTGGMSEGYINYLQREENAHEACADAARWKQFRITAHKYANKP